MNRLILVIAILSLTGCAFLREQKLNVDACRRDAECWSEAIKNAHEIGQKAADVASLAPVPVAVPIAKSVAGYGALVFFLASLGSKLRKKSGTPA